MPQQPPAPPDRPRVIRAAGGAPSEPDQAARTLLEAFDAPTAQQACARRNVTTTPLQALALMNSAFVRDQARRFAERLEAEAPGDRAGQIENGFWLALSRAPTALEVKEASAFLERSPLADFCQILFALDEFAYLD